MAHIGSLRIGSGLHGALFSGCMLVLGAAG